MFGPTLRPALRPLTRVARQFSTEPLRPSSSRGTRTAAIASLTLLVGGVAYSASSRTLRADSRFRESVLDQPSLKENIHPRPGAAEGKAVVEEKQHEAESSQQGAFNEETGEINWDCPCLGGMADGPCGEQFKAAFSCFVFSEAEPKGMDCVDRFKGMQDCFREHPDVYGEEIDDDEEEGDSQIEGIVSSNSSNDGVPATPNKNPPKNSPTLGAHQDNAMTKNASTLH